MLTFRTAFVPSTFNAERRTVELVWTTGAKGLRRSYWDGDFFEELEVSESAVRLGRLNNGAPLLAAHDSWSLGSVIGVVERAWIVKGEGRAIVRFSERAEAAEIMRDVAAGILQNISVGYAVHRYEVSKEADSKIDTYRAVDWEPMEISIVPIGFDDGAKVRSDEQPKTHKVEITQRTKMNDNDDQINSTEAGDGTIEPTTPAARAVLRAERKRVDTILSLTRRANLGDDFAGTLIRDGVPLAEARAAIIDEMAHTQRRSQPDTRSHHLNGFEIGTDYNDPAHVGRAIGEAIHARVNPAYKPSEASHPFIGRSLVELARECLHLRNTSTRMMSHSSIIEHALRGYHGTSDFALALGNAVGRELLRAFETAEPGVLRIGRTVTAQDFRARYPISIGDAPKLEKVNEHGEFRRGTITEAAQPAWKLQTYGKIFSITRQALINDDLGAFTNLPNRMGIEARELEAQTVVDLLVSNAGAGPTMGDGVSLFHADHGNLGSAAAIAVASIGAARAAMRLQKSLNGRVINVVPRYLIVPASKETLAEQLLTDIAATKVSEVNPFGSGKLELIVEPRLDAVSTTAWYVAGDPGRYDSLEVARLAGESGPVVDTRVGFDVDGTEFKIRMDFGAGFVEHRSVYKNPGA